MPRIGVRAAPSNACFPMLSTRGNRTTWTDQYMRMAPKFKVGAKAYSWLNQSLFIGVGRVAGRFQIEYAIYRLEL
jgi:hypothetical protein